MSKEYKVVLAGDFGTGRTAFVTRFAATKSGKSKVAALKAEIYPLKVHTSAGTVVLNIYDSTIHAKGGLPDQGYYRSGDACYLFFDVNSQASYNNLDKHYEAFAAANRRSGTPLPPIIVLGTKIDKAAKDREVQPAEIDWPRKRGLEYVEVSAKGNYNVEEALLALVKSLLGNATQLTAKVDIVKAEVEVDAARAEAAAKAYSSAA